MSTVGKRLLRRLRGRPDPRLPEDLVPALPSEDELADAVTAAGRGRTVDTDLLAGLLLTVARSAGAGLVGRAEQALAAAEPRLWLALDVSARRSCWHAPLWSDTIARRLSDGDPQPLELVLAACHHDGHLREAAVARLSELDHVLAPPVLALRAADWVDQVRARAVLGCERRLADAPAAAFTALAPVAFALRERRAGRRLAEVLEAMLSDGPPDVLTAAIAVGDWRVRRAAYVTGLAAGRLALPRLLHAARTDTDLPIRIRCAEAALRAARATGDTEVPRLLLSSRTAAVRAEAVHALRDDLTTAETALADRSALVRATAQAALRHAGRDPAMVYRALLAGDQPPDPAYLAGLGETGRSEIRGSETGRSEIGRSEIRSSETGSSETGGRETSRSATRASATRGSQADRGETSHSDTGGADAELLHRWLSHPRPRARAETIRALRRLGNTPAGLLLPLLTDPSAAVTRQVTASLRTQSSALDENHLRHLLAGGQPRHVRLAAYRLLHERDTWTRLTVDLELVADPLPVLRHLARADLANWLTREAATTYSMPSANQRERLSTLLDGTVLGTEQVRIMRFHLGLGR